MSIWTGYTNFVTEELCGLQARACWGSEREIKISVMVNYGFIFNIIIV